MEGNGYYGENGTGYGDGWGSNNRRNVGMYGNDASYMQRGLYYDGQSSYGGDMSTQQRLTGLSGYSDMGGNQRMSNNMHSNMGSRRMDYGYGETDMTDGTEESLVSQYGAGNQSSKQKQYQQLGDTASAEKNMLSSYESDIALMQGGSYAGSTPYGRGASKRNAGAGGNYSGSQQGGSNTLASDETASLSFELSKFSPQKRQFGFGNYDTVFDDTKYRIGSGRGFRGRGRGRGRGGWVANDDNVQRGEKRFSGFYQGPYPKKKKQAVGAKNPVSFLNEIRPNLEFKVGDMEGPSNMPTFTVSLEFDGETYTASARSKKIAKKYAAEAALKVYLETSAAKQLGYTEDMIDFSSEQEKSAQESTPETNNVAATTDSESSKAKEEDTLGGKNPVMYLNEIKKGAVYDLKEETGMAHNKNFIMRVTVEGQSFEGSGQSKKLAKSAAAREALKALGIPNVVMPLTENNKGYQMLQKMGWSSGSGLGAREQGSTSIVEPASY